MPDGKFRDNMLTIKLVIPVTSVADPLLCTLPQAPVLEGAGHHYCEGERGYKQTNFSFPFSFQCPEPNGLFPDPEQCDLYYVCEDNVATPELCEDGLLFDTSRRNKESCKLPHGVDCGKREFVQGKKISILCYRIPCQ